VSNTDSRAKTGTETGAAETVPPVRLLRRRDKVTVPKIRAFSVHLLTASGSFLAFLSLVAISDKNWMAAWGWLLAALLVDGIDGPIARRLNVKTVLPNWSGELLDHVIDFTTYVILPAFALYQAGLMGSGLSFLSAAIIVIASAIYYADTGMKTAENFFSGFPVVWNMLVFTLFAANPGEWIAFAAVLISAILSFTPVYFIHPVRVRRLRPLTLAVAAIWGLAAVAIILLYQMTPPHWLQLILVISGIYLYCIGAVLQLFPQLGRGRAA